MPIAQVRDVTPNNFPALQLERRNRARVLASVCFILFAATHNVLYRRRLSNNCARLR